jgi:hypothetical protein
MRVNGSFDLGLVGFDIQPCVDQIRCTEGREVCQDTGIVPAKTTIRRKCPDRNPGTHDAGVPTLYVRRLLDPRPSLGEIERSSPQHLGFFCAAQLFQWCFDIDKCHVCIL